MLAGELAHQAGMKKPKIRAADWDYLSTHPNSGPPRASAAIWPPKIQSLLTQLFKPLRHRRIPLRKLLDGNILRLVVSQS